MKTVIYHCDFCSVEIVNLEMLVKVQFTGFIYGSNLPVHHFDLCKRCYERVIKLKEDVYEKKKID